MKFLVLALLSVAMLWARTDDSPNCQRKYVVSVNDYAPLAYRENGKLRGLAHDIVSEISLRTRCPFMENEVSRPASIDELKRGHSDIVALVPKTPEFEANGTFIPVYKSSRVLLVSKSVWAANKKISDYVNDDKIKFVHMIGAKLSVIGVDENKMVVGGRLIGTPQPEGSFRLFQQGRVQAGFFTALVADYYVKKFKLEDKVVQISDEGLPTEVGFYTSKRRMLSDDDRKLRETIEDMKKDGTLYQIFRKYMSEDEAKRRLK
ncbi:ABC transporter substrate-binding protein [Bdellovibrio sp. NC01]|uniref:substrate-binding periplasmic protein n=1 Tax=Bdellovibrio sp. NC01 TaxID=2220073 RepID=UPI0011578A57|nr:transporter substrate-binding domain-containing protein [Bdellovibrio sp. NC01]QDK38920.1 hypothetical protein DOE51_15665 [Bdellovibrio sp. NC01]